MDIQKVISSAVLKAVKELYGADVPEKMVDWPVAIAELRGYQQLQCGEGFPEPRYCSYCMDFAAQ